MALKPGELADEIETAFQTVWTSLKPDDPFPSEGQADRRVLFLAIARGLLTYLDKHPTDTLSSITMTIPNVQAGPYTVTNVDLNADLT
jgi:hypothetical protein